MRASDGVPASAQHVLPACNTSCFRTSPGDCTYLACTAAHDSALQDACLLIATAVMLQPGSICCPQDRHARHRHGSAPHSPGTKPGVKLPRRLPLVAGDAGQPGRLAAGHLDAVRSRRVRHAERQLDHPRDAQLIVTM